MCISCWTEKTITAEMNNSTVNFSTPETTSNYTTQSIGLMVIGVYSISFLFGLPTHSYVLWLIITESGVTLEFFNLNRSVCEFINCLNSLVSILSICFLNLTIIPLALQGLVFTGCALFQCLMCVERYLALVHPVIFLKYKPLRYRVISSTVAWIITLGFCLCSRIIILSLNMHAHTWFFSLQFLLLFFTQLFCLVAVLRALKQSGSGERGRKPHDEKSFLYNSNNYSEHDYYAYTIYYHRISDLSVTTEHLYALEHSFNFLCTG